MEEGSWDTIPINYSSELECYSLEHHVFMATIGDPDANLHDPNDMLDQISTDEQTTDAPQDDDEGRKQEGEET